MEESSEKNKQKEVAEMYFDKDIYTTNEVAEMFGVTTRTIRNYLKDGRLQGRKIGGSWRFSQEDLENFIATETDDSSLYNELLADGINTTRLEYNVFVGETDPQKIIDHVTANFNLYQTSIKHEAKLSLFISLVNSKLIRIKLVGESKYIDDFVSANKEILI